MTAIRKWIRLFLAPPKVEPFVPEEDEHLQKLHEVEAGIHERQQRRERRRDWLSEPLSSRFKSPYHHGRGPK